jgi:beta-glucosidase
MLSCLHTITAASGEAEKRAPRRAKLWSVIIMRTPQTGNGLALCYFSDKMEKTIKSKRRGMMRSRLGLRIPLGFLCLMGMPALGHGVVRAEAEQPALVEANKLATALIDKMTLDEKLGQLVNVAPAIPRLHIPAYNWWTESLHGALGAIPTTNFPEPIGLAASFDAPLVHGVAGDISAEIAGLHALGRKTGKLGRIGTGLDVWAPNINIFRDPRWGRGQETYGEDPYLTSQMGVAYVEGMQGPNPALPRVIASPKHFDAYSGPEPLRHKMDEKISLHDLEDTYLPAFRAAIVDAQAGSIMCSYNAVNGQPACANDFLLKTMLRGAWNFKGYVVSDCDAVSNIADGHHYVKDQAEAVAAALKAGVDNECNGATLGNDGKAVIDRYREALHRGLITVADIDRALVRLFSARFRNGDLPGLNRPGAKPAPTPPLIGGAHTKMALESAEESLVLLKNDGILPLKPGLKIAVAGPLADATRVLRGNYSSVLSAPPVSVLAGLRRALPKAQITLVPFGPSITDGDSIPDSAFLTPDGKPGLLAQYFKETGTKPAGKGVRYPQPIYAQTPAVTRIEPNIAARGNDSAAIPANHRVVWTGFLVAPRTGTYRIGLTGMTGSVSLDGKIVATLPMPNWGGPAALTNIELVKGRRTKLRVVSAAHGLSGIELRWKYVSKTPEADLRAAAAKADVIVVVVGLTSDLEGEEMPLQIPGFSGGDRTSLELPPEQRAFLQQAKATGKPLVIVLMNGSPIALQWAKQNAAAIVEAWYPGEEGGLAVGHVLAGQYNPAGRLPLTFYAALSDLPPFDDYSMRGRTYRYFTGTPVYPFGYGLSYTSFAYAPLKVVPVHGAARNGVRVTTEVVNTGKRAGEDVAELYLTPPAFDGAPRLALRGFQRVSLKPGERRQLVFDLSPRDLSFVTAAGVRQIMQGTYKVSVGSGQPGTGVAFRAEGFALARTEALPQ